MSLTNFDFKQQLIAVSRSTYKTVISCAGSRASWKVLDFFLKFLGAGKISPGK